MRFRARRGEAGLSVDRLRSAGTELLRFLDANQVADLPQHTRDLRTLLALDATADPAEPERAERPAVLLRLADLAADLGDLQLGHASSASLTISGAARNGSTSAIVFPPMRATSSGRRSDCSALTVALSRLIGFVVPRLFASTSRMPASSSTARTPPPAITPVPSLAGRSNTRAASARPITSCVIVDPFRGTLKRFFFASSTAFEIASGTSRALP